MNPIDFMRTVYLGDRACKSISIDGDTREVKIRINVISRVRSGSWNFYSAEDLVDGCVVFEGVRSITFDPSGPLPNDQIDILSVEPDVDQSTFRFTLAAEAVDNSGDATRVAITISAASVSLEDVAGTRIRT